MELSENDIRVLEEMKKQFEVAASEELFSAYMKRLNEVRAEVIGKILETVKDSAPDPAPPGPSPLESGE